MFGTDREAIRRFFQHCRLKQQRGDRLQPLERLVADVIAMHPEYHGLLDGDEAALQQDFGPDSGQTNPFLHMGMHISLGEQLAADHPNGIRLIYQRLLHLAGDDAHACEHRMMECLGLSLWEAQRQGAMPDQNDYLDCLKKLIK